MSAPAAKALSLPATTIAPMPSSASNSASACPSAFSAFGRLRVIVPTRPRVPTMMFSYAIGVDFREEPQGEAPDFIRPPSPCPLPQAGEGMMFLAKGGRHDRSAYRILGGAAAAPVARGDVHRPRLVQVFRVHPARHGAVLRLGRVPGPARLRRVRRGADRGRDA